MQIISGSLDEAVTLGGAEEISKDGNVRIATQQLVLERTHSQVGVAIVKVSRRLKRGRTGACLLVAQGNRFVLTKEPGTLKALGQKPALLELILFFRPQVTSPF